MPTETTNIPQLAIVIAVVASFCIGFTFGFLTRNIIVRYISRGKDGRELNLIDGQLFVTIIISTLFALALLVAFVDRTYEVPIPIYGLMGAVVGFFLKLKNDKKPDTDPES